MDIKTYISSGILELYATGHLSEDEQKEVEAILQKYPEAKEELLAIQKHWKITHSSMPLQLPMT
ncbi:MAG: hypothetical protein IPH36_14010 [Saprospiraceae bacterium]|nr:hypothetical protein [Saprospiraceae bacterium]